MERTQEYITLEYSLILFCIAEKDWLDGVVALEAGQWTSNKALLKLQKKAVEKSKAERYLNESFLTFFVSCDSWSSYFDVAEMCIETPMNAITGTENTASSVPPCYIKDYILGKTDTLSDMLSRYMHFLYHKKTKNQFTTEHYDKTLRDFHHAFFYFMKAIHVESSIN